MNERILELADEARIKFSSHWAHEGVDTSVITRRDLKEFAESLQVPVLGYLRDTQYYLHMAAHGLSMFDITPSKVQKDLEQWEPICHWLDQD